MKTTEEILKEKYVREFGKFATCFGCRSEGIGATGYETESGHVVGEITAKECHEGFEGVIHGGIIGTYFDEVMWKQTRVMLPEMYCMTVEMNVKYLKPVHVGDHIKVVTSPGAINGRLVTATAELVLPDGSVAATSEGKYIAMKDEKFNDAEKKRPGTADKLLV